MSFGLGRILSPELVDAGDDFLAGLLHRAQVAVESHSEHPHPQVEEQSHGHDHGRDDVEPPALKGARVGLDRHDGVEIEL